MLTDLAEALRTGMIHTREKVDAVLGTLLPFTDHKHYEGYEGFTVYDDIELLLYDVEKAAGYRRRVVKKLPLDTTTIGIVDTMNEIKARSRKQTVNQEIRLLRKMIQDAKCIPANFSLTEEELGQWKRSGYVAVARRIHRVIQERLGKQVFNGIRKGTAKVEQQIESLFMIMAKYDIDLAELA